MRRLPGMKAAHLGLAQTFFSVWMLTLADNMKRSSKCIVGVLAVAIASVTLWMNIDILMSSPGTQEQGQYLPVLLAKTSEIIIRRHPKLGGDVLAVVTSSNDVSDLVAATKLTRVMSPCACFGFVEIDFVGVDGLTNTVNYKSNSGDRYLKFNNEWNIQGLPSKQFSRLVAKHIKTENGRKK